MKQVKNEANIYLAGQDIEAIKEELNTRETDMKVGDANLEPDHDQASDADESWAGFSMK